MVTCLTVESEQVTIKPVQRLRLTFRKGGVVRYIGHLDLARALERAINRARVPVAYTQGFNRRPRISLAAALPLGYTSDAEMVDVWLLEALAPEEMLARLEPKLPAGITVIHVEEVILNSPSLQQLLSESTYEVEFLDPVDGEQLRREVERVVAAATLPRERKKDKQRPTVYDLRPLILDLQLDDAAAGAPRLRMCLRQTASQFGRPDEVLRELGHDPLDTRINRVAIGLGGDVTTVADEAAAAEADPEETND